MDNKEKYRQFCEAEGARIPLFQQWWWWETVCVGKRWDVLLAERDGRVAGAMPVLLGRKACLRYSLMPQLTMFTGPWLADASDREVFDDLFRQLAERRFVLYVGRLSPAVSAAGHALPRGYRPSLHYTYRFDPIRPLPELMAAASPLRRRDYKRLGAMLAVDTAVAAEEFADFHTAYMQGRGRRDLLPHGLMVRVCSEAVRRGQGLVVGARDAGGSLQAALFVACDAECAYMLMLARGPEAPRNAMAFLVWRTVELMGARVRVFDFEGSMEPGVEEFYRSFGPRRVDMTQVRRVGLPFNNAYGH